MSTGEGVVHPRRRRGAIITLLIGVALILSMPLIGVVGALFSGLGGAVQASQGPVFVSPNPNLMEVHEGREVRLLVPIDARAPHVSACTITAPSGADVEPHPLPQTSATEQRYGSDLYYAFARFQATESGEYVVDCSASEAVVAAAVERTSPWIMPLIWIGGAVVGVLIGATLLIIGIIRLVRVNRHNRELKSGAGVQNPGSGGVRPAAGTESAYSHRDPSESAGETIPNPAGEIAPAAPVPNPTVGDPVDVSTPVPNPVVDGRAGERVDANAADERENGVEGSSAGGASMEPDSDEQGGERSP